MLPEFFSLFCYVMVMKAPFVGRWWWGEKRCSLELNLLVSLCLWRRSASDGKGCCLSRRKGGGVCRVYMKIILFIWRFLRPVLMEECRAKHGEITGTVFKKRNFGNFGLCDDFGPVTECIFLHFVVIWEHGNSTILPQKGNLYFSKWQIVNSPGTFV